MEQVAALVKEIETFCRQAGLAETTFGRQAVNDGKLMRRLREGKGITLKTMERARSYMQSHSIGHGAEAPNKPAQPADRRPAGLARPIFTPVSSMPVAQRTDILRAKRIDPTKVPNAEEGGREFRFYD